MGHRVAGILPYVVVLVGWLVWFPLSGQAAEGDISGTITSSHGPEQGVWVIAETTDLPTQIESRGIHIDRDGVVRTALSGSSHFARFDRTQCGVIDGPTVIDGRHCVGGGACI